jgi:hypothetical protein
MQTVIHLNSADEFSQEILESIRKMFHSRPITISVEDSFGEALTEEEKNILDSRLQEPDACYISAEKSLKMLKLKHGL